MDQELGKVPISWLVLACSCFRLVSVDHDEGREALKLLEFKSEKGRIEDVNRVEFRTKKESLTKARQSSQSRPRIRQGS